MQNIIFTLALFGLFSVTVSAQSSDFRLFELDFGLNLANPTSNQYLSEGNPLYIEPRFNITNNISAGVRWETVNIENTSLNTESRVRSRQFTVDYYLPGDTRFFVGTGIGRYVYEDAGGETADVSQFGFAPRAGVELGHFRAGVTYNIISGNNLMSPDYVGINIGWVLWGGRK